MDDSQYTYGKPAQNEEENWAKDPATPKEVVNFATSGLLTEEANMHNGVVVQYNQPAEARKPKRRWRLYPFKGEEQLEPMYIHRQSAYMIGRDTRVS